MRPIDRRRSSPARRFRPQGADSLEPRALLSAPQHFAVVHLVSPASSAPAFVLQGNAHAGHRLGTTAHALDRAGSHAGMRQVLSADPAPATPADRTPEIDPKGGAFHQPGRVEHYRDRSASPAGMRKQPRIRAVPARFGITDVAAPWDAGAQGPIAVPLVTPASAPFTPSQVRHAYGVDRLGLNGSGQTIAIVTAYDSPTINSDLSTFSQAFGLAQANLVKALPASGTPRFDASWAFETALDVEWAHAIAPGARILLVEAASSSIADLMAAVNYAVAQRASVVSMSWGAGEFWWESYYDTSFAIPGTTFLAAAGDNGAAAMYPAASPNVTAVGGTSLQLDTDGNRLGETGWGGSGGATSAYELRPAYQGGFLGGAGRGTPDVAYNADPNTGLYVYTTSSSGSWYAMNGTSAGTPQWAGLIALANQGRAAQGRPSLGTGYLNGTNQVLYSLAGGTSYTNPHGDYLDVTAGSNGYLAAVGFDLVTGLGAPVADRLVTDLISA